MTASNIIWWGSWKKKTKQDGPTIAERKQNSNCYHCGQQGHWASECPIKDIPAYDQDFWSDIDNMMSKEMPTNEAPQIVQQEPQPIQPLQPVPQILQSVPQAIQPVPPTPKRRKLSLKKKENQWKWTCWHLQTFIIFALCCINCWIFFMHFLSVFSVDLK